MKYNSLQVLSITLFLFLSLSFTQANNYKVPTQSEIEQVATKVADWQIANFTHSTANRHDYGVASWGHSTLYIGMFDWAQVRDDNNRYADWLLNTVGTTSNWKLNGIYPYHADEFCAGQFFSQMYEKYNDEEMLANTLERVDDVMSANLNNSMGYTNKQRWTWCDALFMAPPLYAKLARIMDDSSYLEFMYTEYRKTYNHLFDKEEQLYFRDDSYFNKREANGEKIFWGRGNGWAIAGTANIIKELPADSKYLSFFNTVFRRLALSLIEVQSSDGAWHASLLDPASYPAAETSATALITYALAYGLNNGLLEADEAYIPVMKAWAKLVNAVQSNGKLGWVQPIGQDPKTITKDMTAPFGVGGFLMAAAEIHKLLDTSTSVSKNIDEEFFSHPDTKITLYALDGRILFSDTLKGCSLRSLIKNTNLPAAIYIVKYELNGVSIVLKHTKN